MPEDLPPELEVPVDQEGVVARHWILLLGLTTNYMVAAEAMIEGLQGNLGVDTRGANALKKAAQETNKRVDAYLRAKRALVEYAREIESAVRD